MKIGMQGYSPEKTKIPHPLFPNDLNFSGFVIVGYPDDLTIQSQSHECGPIEQERQCV